MENSKHLPFEEWLLSERSLSSYQQQALDEHLQSCDDCVQLQNSWDQVHNLFLNPPQVAPQAGFTARWLQRQAAVRTHQQHRNAWVIFGIVAVNVVIFFIFIALQVAALVSTPSQWLYIKAYYLSQVYAIFSFTQSLFDVMSEMALSIPLIGLMFLFGSASLLAVFWFVAYRQLTVARRIKS